MTWLELIDELRKCPLCLLEEQAVVYGEEDEDHEMVTYEIAQLVGPNNPCEDGQFLWEQMERGYPDARLSLTFVQD